MKGVFQYPSSQDFLRATYEAAKKSRPSLTMAAYSEKLGIGHSTFKMILTGKRKLSISKAHQLARYFRFSIEEQNYFESLVLRDHAKTTADAKLYGQRAATAKSKGKLQAIVISKSELLVDAYTLPILLYLTDIIKKDLSSLFEVSDVEINDIATRFGLSIKIVQKTIHTLNKSHVPVELDSEKQQVQYVFDKAVASLKQKAYLKSWLSESAHRIESQYNDPRTFFNASTVTISENALADLNRELREVLQKYMALDETGSKKQQVQMLQLVQVGIQSFPLLRS